MQFNNVVRIAFYKYQQVPVDVHLYSNTKGIPFVLSDLICDRAGADSLLVRPEKTLAFLFHH